MQDYGFLVRLQQYKYTVSAAKTNVHLVILKLSQCDNIPETLTHARGWQQ